MNIEQLKYERAWEEAHYSKQESNMAIISREKFDNIFKFGQLVCHKGKAYIISAVILKRGYDSHLWEYNLTKHTYSDMTPDNMSLNYGRCDYDSLEKIKEHEILAYEDAKKAEFAELEKKKLALQEEIDKINALQNTNTHARIA